MAQQKSRWATKGALAMAATALAVTGCAAATASAASAAPAAPAASTAPAAGTGAVANTVTTSVAAPAAYTAPTRNLAQGMSGADVESLQQRLAALKYYPGSADGKFGGNTLAALWAFQEINGVHVSGVVDAATKTGQV
jgi:peptidoglycan hydrolase-like protein with peptidoglycan-binding domain